MNGTKGRFQISVYRKGNTETGAEMMSGGLILLGIITVYRMETGAWFWSWELPDGRWAGVKFNSFRMLWF
jgi:hypothetical protein